MRPEQSVTPSQLPLPYNRRSMPARHLAIYTGSFDPITFGHLDVLRRARSLFDEIIVAIGHNPEKRALFNYEERMDMASQLIRQLLTDEPGGANVRVEHYTGLTVDFARKVNAAAILRGIRNITDLAAECQLAITNRQVAGIETVFIVTGESFAYTSSSLIKQIAALGGSIDHLASLVPPIVIDRLRAKRNDPHNPLGKLAQDDLAE
jgi:pantetheine-phosphate adenylyltransferase